MNQFWILLVEDDENDIHFLEHAFRKAGIVGALKVVRDGQEAVDYLSGAGVYADRNQFPLPSLVLLDLKMPRKNGMEVLAWIRRQVAFKNLIVIVLSSSVLPSDISQAYQLGANGFVSKPSSMERRSAFADAIKAFWMEFNLV